MNRNDHESIRQQGIQRAVKVKIRERGQSKKQTYPHAQENASLEKFRVDKSLTHPEHASRLAETDE